MSPLLPTHTQHLALEWLYHNANNREDVKISQWEIHNTDILYVLLSAQCSVIDSHILQYEIREKRKLKLEQ